MLHGSHMGAQRIESGSPADQAALGLLAAGGRFPQSLPDGDAQGVDSSSPPPYLALAQSMYGETRYMA